ncbi:MAG TPA: bacteriohemerythrin [Desulfobulbus sp.]|nr:bacteriohemerythrin [Desulfobulbus sp.]
MLLIKWRDSYSVGIDQIDQEHKKLVELINEVFIVVRDKGHAETLNSAVDTLVEYTGYHFAAEEKAMEEARYPDLDKHREEHQRLEKEVVGFQQRLAVEGDAIRTEFYHFLRDWLIHHIVECDMLYSAYLVKQAV